MDNVYRQRVATLRELMRRKGWDAVIIGGADPHGSEYPAPRWKQVEWLSGFTGEAGDIVVTHGHAGLWTDTRYFIQADRQLAGSGIELHKTRVPGQILIPEWLAGIAFSSSETVNIAIDSLCQSVEAVQQLKRAFPDEKEVRIISIPNLMDFIWLDRPAVPHTPISFLEEQQVGESSESKVEWLRSWLRGQDCDAMLVTALDEIAWILNVRASDIDYNPLVISYLIVSQEDIEWYTRESYDEISLALAEGRGRLFVDPDTLNYHIYNIIQNGNIKCGCSPIPLRKAIKNPVEINGMRQIHIEDGIAMEKFLYWLEKNLGEGAYIDEWDASCKLSSLRAAIPGYHGDSFETISAYGPGAALPHYITPHENAPVLKPRGLFLCDSGGQYDTGTTDITRTVPLGPCSVMEKEDYTLVLKGHIGLAKAIFPKGTAGCQIDALAREPLWSRFRSFGHGTGHGVGFYLGVHEGPQSIRQDFNSQPILPGMFISNEPGIYREGLHGVRHENIILCSEICENDFGEWLGFETVTLCHFDTSAIIRNLLDEEDISWLNNYNARVFDTLHPYLDEEEAEWLRKKTLPI